MSYWALAPNHQPSLLTGVFAKPLSLLVFLILMWGEWAEISHLVCHLLCVYFMGYFVQLLLRTGEEQRWNHPRSALEVQARWLGDTSNATLLQAGPPLPDCLQLQAPDIAIRDAHLSCGGVGWASPKVLSFTKTFPPAFEGCLCALRVTHTHSLSPSQLGPLPSQRSSLHLPALYPQMRENMWLLSFGVTKQDGFHFRLFPWKWHSSLLNGCVITHGLLSLSPLTFDGHLVADSSLIYFFSLALVL